jgi:hypothetical protein
MTKFSVNKYTARGVQPFVGVIALLASACAWGATPQLTETNPLTSSILLQEDLQIESPLPTAFFAPPEDVLPPDAVLKGVLELKTSGNQGRIEVIKDSFGIAEKKELALTQLPPFSVQLVSDGDDLIPLIREPRRSAHPYWELITGSGKTWKNTENTGWSQAALPFALKEKNQNCLHNGMLTFLYRGDGSVSRVAWQISSETCLYFKANLWGTAEASYTRQTPKRARNVRQAYHKQVSLRLPVRPLTKLMALNPDFDLSALKPPGHEDTSVYGLVIGGTHYRSDCPTRHGPYPFCDELLLPSYSLAKSLVGSLSYQLMVKRWPEFAKTPVSTLVPECKLPDKRWDDVLPKHLLDMTTGNYDSTHNVADEGSSKMNRFFLAETHAGKVEFSCNAWPRQSAPGTQWVYHTSDTYLLGVAMNNFVKQQLGPNADFYTDFLYPQAIEPLGLSQAMAWTQRTYDETAQPFAGYGLVLRADDIARFARALNNHPPAGYPELSTFSKEFVANTTPGAKGIAYKGGFWGADLSTWMNCSGDTWVPFLSGYGGIVVVMLPNGGIHYYFTDSDQHGFRTAVSEANKALNYCKE